MVGWEGYTGWNCPQGIHSNNKNAQALKLCWAGKQHNRSKQGRKILFSAFAVDETLIGSIEVWGRRLNIWDMESFEAGNYATKKKLQTRFKQILQTKSSHQNIPMDSKHLHSQSAQCSEYNQQTFVLSSCGPESSHFAIWWVGNTIYGVQKKHSTAQPSTAHTPWVRLD